MGGGGGGGQGTQSMPMPVVGISYDEQKQVINNRILDHGKMRI